MTTQKDDGIEIGSCPIHIGDGNYSSKYPKASDFQSSGVAFISASDFENGRISAANFRYISEEQHKDLRKGHLKANDVLIVTRGNGIGQVAWVDAKYEGCNINAQLALLRADEKEIHSRYLYFLLSSKEYFQLLREYGSGSAQPQLTITSLLKVPIKFPEYKKQVQIADILSSIDNKILLNNQMNETLEAMARAIFKEWFIDFGPVRSKAEGRRPFGMDDDTAALFPDSFEESELGMIPKGWQVNKYIEDIYVIGGGTPRTSVEEYWNGDIPWFSVVDSPKDGAVWIIDTEKKITDLGVKSSRTKILDEGTVILTARGTVGKLGLVGNPMAMNQSCYALKPKEPCFLYYYYLIHSLVSQLKGRSHGSVFDTITTNTIESLRYASCPKVLKNRFHELLFNRMIMIKNNLIENKFLVDTRDLLLPRLISGEIKL